MTQPNLVILLAAIFFLETQECCWLNRENGQLPSRILWN